MIDQVVSDEGPFSVSFGPPASSCVVPAKVRESTPPPFISPVPGPLSVQLEAVTEPTRASDPPATVIGTLIAPPETSIVVAPLEIERLLTEAAAVVVSTPSVVMFRLEPEVATLTTLPLTDSGAGVTTALLIAAGGLAAVMDGVVEGAVGVVGSGVVVAGSGVVVVASVVVESGAVVVGSLVVVVGSVVVVSVVVLVGFVVAGSVVVLVGSVVVGVPTESFMPYVSAAPCDGVASVLEPLDGAWIAGAVVEGAEAVGDGVGLEGSGTEGAGVSKPAGSGSVVSTIVGATLAAPGGGFPFPADGFDGGLGSVKL